MVLPAAALGVDEAGTTRPVGLHAGCALRLAKRSNDIATRHPLATFPNYLDAAAGSLSHCGWNLLRPDFLRGESTFCALPLDRTSVAGMVSLRQPFS